MIKSSLGTINSMGREFIDLYALYNGEDKKIENILYSARQKNSNIKNILKLIEVKKIGGLYEDILCQAIYFIGDETSANKAYDFPLIDCESSAAANFFRELNRISDDQRKNLIEFIDNLLNIDKNRSNTPLLHKKQIKNAVSILGMLNAIELFSSFKIEEDSNNIEHILAIDLVFNKAYDDARVVKSAKSLAGEFKTFAIGYDLKNNIGNEILTFDGISYFVSENIKSRYANFLKKQVKSWSDHYQTQQAFFLGYCFGIALQLIENFHPRKIVLYSHDMHSIVLGKWLKTQISYGCSLDILWIHDFHEYVEGVEFSSEDRLDFFLKSEEYAINDVDCPITVSPGLADILNKKYHKNFFVVYNSFNPDKRDVALRYKTARKFLEIQSEFPLIIYSGGITKQRRVGLPLRAMTKIKDLFYCIITNDTADTNTELARIMEYAKTLSVDQRIVLHPYVEAEYAWELMVDSTACLSMLPRYPNGDIALPNKLFDSIKAQVPFFSSDNPELKKFITENKCGAVFSADDEISFTVELEKLISRPTHMKNIDFYPYSWSCGFSKIYNFIKNKWEI